MLSACGGGGGGSSNDTLGAQSQQSSETIVEGVVADGYLFGATVCLDLNDNKRCDENEPSAISENGGKFTLNHVNSSDRDNHGIVVEVSEDTIDEDTGEAVGKAYVMTSPPGMQEFISPLTTMTHTTMEIYRLPVNEAEQFVIQKMGYVNDSSISLFKDYVELDSNATYQQIHKIARIAAHILGKNHTPLKISAQEAGIDPKVMSSDLQNLVVQQILNQLESIKSIAIEKTDNSEFSEAELESLTVIINTDNFVSDLERVAATRTAEDDFDLRVLLTANGGLNYIDKYSYGSSCDSERNCTQNSFYRKGNAKFKEITQEKYTWEETAFELGNETWSPAEYTLSNNATTLTNGQWEFSSNQDGYSFDKTKTNQFVDSLDRIYSIIEIDVTEKKLINYTNNQDTVNPFSIVDEIRNPDSVFSSGAKAYLMSIQYQSDLYQVWLSQNGTNCFTAKITYIDETTNCNVVQRIGEDDVLTSIDELFSSDSENPISIRGFGLKIQRSSAQAQEGTAIITLWNGTILSDEYPETTSWRFREPYPGVKLLTVKIPDDHYAAFKKGSTELFFVVIDGYVRMGGYIPEGTITNKSDFSRESTFTTIKWKGYRFNSIAMDNILEQFAPNVN